MLVSSGYLRNGSFVDSTEVVDLKSGKIFSMAPLGRRTDGATGGLLDGLPVICGGSNDNQIHSIAKDQSKFLGQLSVKRFSAASVVLSNNTLWVTGGLGQSGRLKTTEFVTKDGQTSQGPDLPLPVSEHGIVPLNSGAFILIGGLGGDRSATHFYEEKKGWRPGPNLKNGRDGHTAGVLTDRVSTKTYIVAVGGGWPAGSSLEYLEYPGSNDWMKGKPTHSSLDQLQLESHLFMF